MGKQLSINSVESEASHEQLIAHQPAGNHPTLQTTVSPAAISEIQSLTPNYQPHVSILGMYVHVYMY